MKLEITLTNGKWLVNGKGLEDLNQDERLFMDAFFREVKLSQLETV